MIFGVRLVRVRVTGKVEISQKINEGSFLLFSPGPGERSMPLAPVCAITYVYPDLIFNYTGVYSTILE